MTTMMSRIAGAPITWGVDGSPGWGHLMGADRVLAEMAELGLNATELGPDGYLPTDPAELQQKLDHYGLELVGGFVPAWACAADLGTSYSRESPCVFTQCSFGGANRTALRRLQAHEYAPASSRIQVSRITTPAVATPPAPVPRDITRIVEAWAKNVRRF